MNNGGFGGGIILLRLLFDVKVLGGILELKAHIPHYTAIFTSKAFYGIYRYLVANCSSIDLG